MMWKPIELAGLAINGVIALAFAGSALGVGALVWHFVLWPLFVAVATAPGGWLPIVGAFVVLIIALIANAKRQLSNDRDWE